jgi:integrase
VKLIKRIHPGITAHGFRSTFRDWAADQTAYPREVIEHALSHQLKDKAEASYQRSTVFPKRIRLMAAWSNYCDQLPGDSAAVTPIRSKGK